MGMILKNSNGDVYKAMSAKLWKDIRSKLNEFTIIKKEIKQLRKDYQKLEGRYLQSMELIKAMYKEICRPVRKYKPLKETRTKAGEFIKHNDERLEEDQDLVEQLIQDAG